MTTDTANVLVGEGWRDGLEAGVRGRIRGFIEELLDEELTAALGRARYARACASERLPNAAGGSAIGESDAPGVVVPVGGHRNGHRDRQVLGTFGAMTVSVPRARIEVADGKTGEWHSRTLPAYQRRTKEIDSLIACSYLAERVGRALASLFRGSVHHVRLRWFFLSECRSAHQSKRIEQHRQVLRVSRRGSPIQSPAS